MIAKYRLNLLRVMGLLFCAGGLIGFAFASHAKEGQNIPSGPRGRRPAHAGSGGLHAGPKKRGENELREALRV